MKKVSAKTWRFVTRFTSQSSYFHGEHHWPNSTNVEKTDVQSPRLLCYLLESRNIDFHCIERIYLFFKKMPSFCSVPGCRNSGGNDVSSHR